MLLRSPLRAGARGARRHRARAHLDAGHRARAARAHRRQFLRRRTRPRSAPACEQLPWVRARHRAPRVARPPSRSASRSTSRSRAGATTRWSTRTASASRGRDRRSALPLFVGAGRPRDARSTLRYASFAALLAPLGVAPERVVLTPRRAWQLRLEQRAARSSSGATATRPRRASRASSRVHDATLKAPAAQARVRRPALPERLRAARAGAERLSGWPKENKNLLVGPRHRHLEGGALVAELRPDGTLEVLGMGSHESQGPEEGRGGEHRGHGRRDPARAGGSRADGRLQDHARSSPASPAATSAASTRTGMVAIKDRR